MVGTDDAELRASERDVLKCRMTTEAMASVTDGNFVRAHDHYEELLSEFPDDKVALLMRDFTAQQGATPV